MPLRFVCHNCNKVMIVSSVKVGQTARCSSCEAKNIVPTFAVDVSETEAESFLQEQYEKSSSTTMSSDGVHHQEQIESTSGMMVIGVILLIAGAVLSGVQLFLKEDVRVFGSSIGTMNKLPETYLYVGLAGAIIGGLFIVGNRIKNSSTISTTTPPATRVSPPETPSIEPKGKEEMSPSRASIPEQIEQLAKLKEQGILSEAEFEAKKQELLSRL
jgi:positive regulator of sigma E activity